MSDRFTVKEPMGLLVFLTTHLKGWSRSKVKQRLQGGCVVVNELPVTKHDHPLHEGDRVEVLSAGKKVPRGTLELEILYSDRDLIAINKPAGLLSVASADANQPQALSLLRQQLSPQNRTIKLWPAHRLDRDTSGVLLFTTSRDVRETISENWGEAEKVYLAIVEGCPKSEQGTIDQPLLMDAKGFRTAVSRHPEAKRAITHYLVKERSGNRTLLEVRLETGRQHQIRAHLAWLGCPVVGDARYGTPGPCMGLHALRLSILHPESGHPLVIETPPPKAFSALLKKGGSGA